MKEVRRERARGRRSPGSLGESAAGSQRRFLSRALRWAAAALAAAVLPFFVLLRTATWLYGTGRLGTWAALAMGAALTFMVLAVYVLVVARWVRKRLGDDATARSPDATVAKRLVQATAVLVVAFCAYGLVFLSGANAKSDAVRAEYRSLHPHLRLAVATLVLVDSDLLVTDVARSLDDYAAMGLPPNERSLHLRQPDGWAHALDLRTAGRPAWVNGLVRAWFMATGFRTLRHVGTADHLHVSLPLSSGSPPIAPQGGAPIPLRPPRRSGAPAPPSRHSRVRGARTTSAPRPGESGGAAARRSRGPRGGRG